jgi:GNAT superfamily N-acetyltransferase
MAVIEGVRFDCPDADELERDGSLWEIYRDSFPADEREPEAVIVDSVRKQVGLAFRARRDDVTIGIATTHLLENPAAVFLVYLAIHRGDRGGGLGGALLDYAWSESKSRSQERKQDPLGLVWEVDSPEIPTGTAEQLHRERRIAFFQRQGGVVLPRTYFQPPVNGTAPVPMQLMFRSSAPIPDQSTADALVHAMYFEKYGAVNGIPSSILTNLLLR